MVDFDEVDAVRFLEKGGKWQNRQMLICFSGYFATCFQLVLIVFTGFQPNFVCVDKINSTNSSLNIIYDNKCDAFNVTHNTTSTCIGGYVYDVDYRQSIVSEWDLVCNKAYFAETSQLIYTVGMGVGSLLAPLLSDRIGRKWTYLGLRVCNSISSFSLSFSPNVYVFMVGRFLIGSCGMGLNVILYVMMVENIPARLRPFATIMNGIVWCFSLFVQVSGAYLMRNMSWRNLQLVMSIPTLTFLLEMFFVEESIRWLYVNNRTTDGTALLKGAMRLNGIKNEGSMDEMDIMKAKSEMRIRSETEDFLVKENQLRKNKISILDILRNRLTRVMAIRMSIAWSINSLVYYAIFFMSDSFTGDRYLNFFINSVVEVPAYLSLYALLKRFSRKRVLVGLHGLCSVPLLIGGIIMATLKDRIKYIIMMVVSVIGKFVISITFSVLYVYTSEVYPTNFRSSGLGLGSASARVGALISPFAGVLARELPWGPGIIFGSLCLIVAILFVWAAETKDETLPQSMFEIETLLTQKRQNRKRSTDIELT